MRSGLCLRKITLVPSGEWITEEFIANDGQNVRHSIHSPGPLRDKNVELGLRSWLRRSGKVEMFENYLMGKMLWVW